MLKERVTDMKLGCCFGVGDFNAMCIAKQAGLEFAEFALYQFDKLENEKISELKGRLVLLLALIGLLCIVVAAAW